MATSLDLPPYADATAASSAPAQMMRAAQAAQADRDRKAKDQAAESARQDAQLKLNQQAGVRADQNAQEEARKARVAQLPATMATDAIQWDAPDVKGKPFNDLPDYVRRHFIDAYGETGAAVPQTWNESQRAATGNAAIGIPTPPEPRPGQTVHQDAKGGISTQQTYQPPEVKNAGLTGEAALEGLTPDEASMVRNLANYDVPITALSRLPGPQKLRIMARVDQFDPTFSASEYPARQSLKTSVKAGNISENIKAANTAVAHLNTLLESSKALNNRSVPLWNTVANTVGSATGSAAPSNFDTARNAVVSELSKVFKGAGTVPVSEINHWRDVMNSSQSPEQMQGAVRQALELMGGRFGAIQDQYERGMGKPKDFAILTPKSRAILRKAGFDPDELEGRAPAEAPAQPLPPAANSQPKVVIQNGVTYTLQPDGQYR